MAKDEMVTVHGVVEDVFLHRFTVKTEAGMVLADLTPKGLVNVTPKKGDQVTLTGERKPSELKVQRIVLNGLTIEIPDKSHKDDKHYKKPHKNRDVSKLKESIRAQDYTLVGPYRNKPKHVEFLARKGSKHVELHVDLDGKIYKFKSTKAGDDKWRDHA